MPHRSLELSDKWKIERGRKDFELKTKMAGVADRIRKVDDTIFACYFASKNGLSYRSVVESESQGPGK